MDILFKSISGIMLTPATRLIVNNKPLDILRLLPLLPCLKAVIIGLRRLTMNCITYRIMKPRPAQNRVVASQGGWLTCAQTFIQLKISPAKVVIVIASPNHFVARSVSGNSLDLCNETINAAALDPMRTPANNVRQDM